MELKRIVLQDKGRGLGRACVRLLKRIAFVDLKAHRFWLDVKGLNTRAQALYASEGFVEEGRLRESVRVGDGYDCLIVMSMLEREYDARVAGEARRRVVKAAAPGYHDRPLPRVRCVMAARSIASLTLSFGLVSIPVKLYSATETSAAVKFNLLAKDGSRLKQQYVSEKDQSVVARADMVKGTSSRRTASCCSQPRS